MIDLEGGFYTARINPLRGAGLISLEEKKHKAVILRENKTTERPDNPYLYGMPILFPVNRISGGSFLFEGRKYTFPVNEKETGCHLHGMLHESEFEVVKRGTNFVTCAFEKPYLDFPHRFRVEITYTLSDDGLCQVTEITNLSEENMPVFLGFHTTFSIPFLQNGRAEDLRLFAEVGDEIERNMKTYLPTGKIKPPDEVTEKIKGGAFMPLEKIISRHYKSEKSGRMELTDIKKHIKLVYENDEKFAWRLFYNGNAESYICLEPMTCMANCQNAPFDRAYSGFFAIAPHKSEKYVSKIYLEEA